MSHAWFLYSLVATVSFAVVGVLFKLPAVKNHNIFVASFWSVFAPLPFALIFFYRSLVHTDWTMLWISAVWAFFFVIVRFLYLKAYQYADTNLVTPITSTLGFVGVVLVGVLGFHDYLSSLQMLGIGVAVITILLLIQSHWRAKQAGYLWLLLAVISAASVTYKIFQKIGADSLDIQAFQVYQFAFASLFLFILYGIFHASEIKKWPSQLTAGGMFSGSLIGFFSFVGGYAYNLALTKGPFTLINVIHSLYIIGTIFLGVIIFREKLSKSKVLAIGLAVVSAILIRLGS
ncbi:MAG: hypothetical protein A3A33_03835 [Candidatus Yanofskybacteria bacterium RIFCSPLOWO2_01_FULL_49_25]|uniref:EamA domain-containing protein n=1 Tax=Candidatus Yanofskybacteria bacterium RIFCSPLOWO2_01_FULL_49_25 TaxID=1802701 RepID=A0A1F8GXY9_9BACT|nr:MAG: hypothetical protein A3A33_03835 [Candidatus Yanofskybacteria bacterium RIFCSPLOWO2_01_FULL_49_25]